MIKAVLIGSGNVAWHLAPALREADIRWVQVYSPTLEHASRMAERLGGTEAGVATTSREDEIFPDADLYFFAVKDDAIEGISARIAKQIAGREAVAVHVSGASPLDGLRQNWARCGVLYAFASFRITAPCPDLRVTPFCIEASDPVTLQGLQQIAQKLSDKVVEMDSPRRLALHIGGVWVNNYVNLMYTAAEDLFSEAGLDFSLLYPLIAQTADKVVQGQPPRRVQTGPASRGDLATIQRHETYLSAHTPCYLELYRILSEFLQEAFEKSPQGSSF